MYILITDDDKNILDSLSWLLTRAGHDVTCCSSGEEAVTVVDQHPFDIAFMDVMMGGMSGIDTLEKILQIQSKIKVFMISGQADVSMAVRATKLGAYDFLEKPLNPEKVLLEIKKIQEQKAAHNRLKELEKLVDIERRMVGDSLPMRQLWDIIERAAPSEGRILIYGENGSGKELVAREIHLKSQRKNGPFIQLNCAAIPKDLIESELFGYEKGSFTGAIKNKPGLVELAEGGSLLLDEVGDMALETQAKLLRVLQENEFFRLGSSKSKKFNVRVIAATNKNLLEEIDNGRFREDLYFRLNVVPVTVPPLRVRKDDIPLLVNHFVSLYSLRNGKKPLTFTNGALAAYARYGWPGNIRELKNITERLAIMTTHEMIDVDDVNAVLGVLPPAIDFIIKNNTVDSMLSLKDQVADYEKAVIQNVYTKYNGNISKVAQALQTDRANLYKKLKSYGIK